MKKTTDKEPKQTAISPREAKTIEKAIEKYGSIDEVLTAFREGLKADGYKGIKKEMIPVVKHYGNVRDKTLLIFIAYADAGKNLISQREAFRIRDEIMNGSQEEQLEHVRLFFIFKALSKVKYIYKAAKYSCFSVINHLLTEICKYESITLANKFSREVIEIIPEGKRKEYLYLMQHLKNAVSLVGISPDIKESHTISEELYEIPIQDYLSSIKEKAETLEDMLGEYKSIIATIYEWCNEMDAIDFLPYDYRTGHKDMSERLQSIHPKWFKHKLSSDDKTNEYTAFLTAYEDIKTDSGTSSYIRQNLEDSYEEYQ